MLGLTRATSRVPPHLHPLTWLSIITSTIYNTQGCHSDVSLSPYAGSPRQHSLVHLLNKFLATSESLNIFTVVFCVTYTAVQSVCFRICTLQLVSHFTLIENAAYFFWNIITHGGSGVPPSATRNNSAGEELLRLMISGVGVDWWSLLLTLTSQGKDTRRRCSRRVYRPLGSATVMLCCFPDCRTQCLPVTRWCSGCRTRHKSRPCTSGRTRPALSVMIITTW